MITLYAVDSPNVLKIYLALEELDLAYEAKPVDVMAGQNFSAEFAAINPNGKVPVIVDAAGPGGEPMTIFESGAILLYLAEKTGKLLSGDPRQRSQTIQWLMVQMSGLGPIFGQYIHFLLFAPEGNDYAMSRYKTLTYRILSALEARLGEVDWLGGSDYGIADIATFPWIRPIDRVFGPEIAITFPRLARWTAKIAERPATARALAGIEAINRLTTATTEAAPQHLDLVFGRGAHARA
ncbi:MAG: glutathione S-transferase N-terminal domain-containing protein [Pseudomonadota bacterium]